MTYFSDISPSNQLDKHRYSATRVRILKVQKETSYDFHRPEIKACQNAFNRTNPATLSSPTAQRTAPASGK